MDCRTTAAHTFTTKLGLKPYDVILTKEELVKPSDFASNKTNANVLHQL